MAEEKTTAWPRRLHCASSGLAGPTANLDQEEADAIVRTALEEGLDITERIAED